MMSLGPDDKVVVHEQLLSLRFGFRSGTIYVEEEVFDANGELCESIFQVKDSTHEGYVWNLTSGTYKVYGLSDVQMSGSTIIMTPPTSTSTVHVPGLATVKVEPTESNVQILSDSDDDNVNEIKLSDISSNPFQSRGLLGSARPFQHHSRSSVSPSLSSGHPPIHPNSRKSRSILFAIRNTASRKGSRSELSRIDFDSIDHEQVKYLPPTYDGEKIFELPPLPEGIPTQFGGSMDGMSKQYDGHTWCKTITTNIKNEFGLTYRRSSCTGHLECPNQSCDYICRNNGKVNCTEWSGVALIPFSIGGGPSEKSTLACKVCQTPPICLALCDARIYHVSSNDNDVTRAAIHLGCHNHPVSQGTCQDSMDIMYDCVAKEVQKTPNAKNSAIIMAASKNYLADALIRPTPGGSNLQGASMDVVMDQFETLTSPNLRNFVSGTKRFFRQGRGVTDSILELKDYSNFVFIHQNQFPGQNKGKVFVFKMSVDRPGSGVDLVKRMQPGGDLQDCWVMFDHVKRVSSWTTMACHVYDSKYCKVMTIALCDMQSEDAEAQELFWLHLNEVMRKNGLETTNFKGFMADSAGANWHAVRKVYGNGDPNKCMENRERTCLFHWTKCLQRATSKNILPGFQDQHIAMCKVWKDAKSQEEAEAQYNVIRGWWLSSGATTEDGRRSLNDWMAFWHFRYRQWGGSMQLVSLCITSHVLIH